MRTDLATFRNQAALESRTSNIAYMAGAMDALDGVLAPPSTSAGQKQFDHLLGHFPETALIYFMLRRHQRAGNQQKLGVGLLMLLDFEKREITIEDVLAEIYDPSWTTARLASLPAPVKAIAA